MNMMATLRVVETNLDLRYWIAMGRWYQQKEVDPFRLSAYWHNADTIGILSERSTGRAFIVSKDFYAKGRWRME